MFNIILAIALSVSGSISVNGMDGVIEVTDDYGNIMIVEADCARVIYDSGVDNLEEIHRNGVTATPEYIEACF